VRTGHALTHFEDLGDSVLLQFSDSPGVARPPVRARAVIGADGIHSAVRALMSAGEGVGGGLSYLGVFLVIGISETRAPLLTRRGFYTLDGRARLFTMPFRDEGAPRGPGELDGDGDGDGDGGGEGGGEGGNGGAGKAGGPSPPLTLRLPQVTLEIERLENALGGPWLTLRNLRGDASINIVRDAPEVTLRVLRTDVWLGALAPIHLEGAAEVHHARAVEGRVESGDRGRDLCGADGGEPCGAQGVEVRPHGHNATTCVAMAIGFLAKSKDNDKEYVCRVCASSSCSASAAALYPDALRPAAQIAGSLRRLRQGEGGQDLGGGVAAGDFQFGREGGRGRD
jgi:hypothetical protein